LSLSQRRRHYQEAAAHGEESQIEPSGSEDIDSDGHDDSSSVDSGSDNSCSMDICDEASTSNSGSERSSKDSDLLEWAWIEGDDLDVDMVGFGNDVLEELETLLEMQREEDLFDTRKSLYL